MNIARAACLLPLFPLAWASFACGPASAASGNDAPVRLLIKPRAGLPEFEFLKHIEPHGGQSLSEIQGIGVRVVELPAQASAQAVEALLAHNPHFEFAELDRQVSAAATADDPYFSSAWHLPLIGAPAAWDLSRGEDIVIAILDTGINGAHADLAGRTVPGWNFYDGNSDTSDVNGHGTAVAGAAAASTNNAAGVASVAPGAYLMPVRIADPGAYAYWSTVAQGLTWAADQGVKVANISYNGVSASSTVQAAAQYLKNRGGVTVVSAGNSYGQEFIAPSDTMITVSATNASDQRASFSSWGDYVDLAAPGKDIWTTNKGGGYGKWNGTSFSSPIVAGVVAQMMAANPALSPAAIEQLLFSTALDLGDAGWDITFGHGRVSADQAVAAANAWIGSDTVAPVVSIAAPTGGSVAGTVSVDVSATDDTAVSHVELLVNGITLASDAAHPYAFAWDSTSVADGSVAIAARAFDAAGNSTVSPSISVTVQNAPDVAPPVVHFVTPSAGANVKTSVRIALSASDDRAVTSLKLSIDGSEVASGAGAGLSYTWNTAKVSKGTHTLLATATDAAGNLASHSIQVTK